MKKIILTGGGTVGHISPIIALIEVLKKNSRIDYLYVGSRNGPECEIAKKNQIKFKGIFAGKRRNYSSFSNFIDFFKIIFGLIQAYFILIIFKPDVIFSKGGYVAFPIVFWAKRFKIPLVIHESDTVMGSINVYASKFAKKICVGFPIENYQNTNINFDKLIYTGTPLRKEFYNTKPVKPEKQTILVTGGSQGASKINNLILEILPELVKTFEIYHLIGKNDFENIKACLKAKFSDENYHPMDFTENMADLMNKADLVISRAGSTVAEISALGKASILIPLPSAHMDHQTKNAQIYADKNAAVLVSEKNLTAGSLLSIIKRLLEDDEFRLLIGHHAKEFATENATQDIIDILFKVSEDSYER